MRVCTHLRLVIRFKDTTENLLKKLIFPGGYTERSLTTLFLRDIETILCSIINLRVEHLLGSSLIPLSLPVGGSVILQRCRHPRDTMLAENDASFRRFLAGWLLEPSQD